MVCALEAHSSEPSIKRKRAAQLLDTRFAKKQRHTMATCASHCDGQTWCSIPLQGRAMWIADIAAHVRAAFSRDISYGMAVDCRLGDPSTYQVMVVETEEGLLDGLAMLEETLMDNVVAMDLVWVVEWGC